MYGHPTGIRAVALSSDDTLACTVSKNVTKVWNVASRSCIQSLSPTVSSSKSDKKGCYGLCATFLPGNTHVVVGTREGHLLIIDISAGEIVFSEEGAHDGAIWSLDVRRPTPTESTITLVTGSADRTVKFWDVESQDEDDDSVHPTSPMVVQTRTLQMTDDVVAVRYSHSTDPYKRLVFVSTLDCTIKVFFDDSLKLFLSLYGHKLPALAIDASDDDTILVSSGADKTVKIWGLDFGDTHKTLHGHEDSVTEVRFVKRTHNFFTASKDGTVRFWDGDRFEQILLLSGHGAEINCLAVSRTGAFVLSGGMDRQVRVWERTKDIVFLEEERERELEQVFDKVSNREDGGTANILGRKGEAEDDEIDRAEDEPQSEAAVKKSVMSVSSGDRIMEALERADQELAAITSSRNRSGDAKPRQPSPLLLGLEPAQYVLWILRSVKSAELEQSLLVLPLGHLERLVYYIIVLLKSGRGVELCSRVAVFMVKTHQNQVSLCLVRSCCKRAMMIRYRFTCQTNPW
jgi:U3 small nucleolar RNA-associated protein 12